jgi:hypothetical protein
MNKEVINDAKYYIKELKLSGIIGSLDVKLADAYKNDEPYEEIIRDIFREAYDVRKENGRKRRIRNANFPYIKGLEELKKEYLPVNAQKKLKKSTYSMANLQTLPKEDQHPLLVRALSTGLSVDEMLDQIGDGVAHFQTKLDVNLNIEFDGRSITGDDPYNYKDKRYGNAFVVGSL